MGKGQSCFVGGSELGLRKRYRGAWNTSSNCNWMFLLTISFVRPL